MDSYLLTYNPSETFRNLRSLQEEISERGLARYTWRCHSKQLRRDDRVYWMRQGKEPRGIFASGWATGPTSGTGTRRIAHVVIEVLLDPDTTVFPVLGSRSAALGVRVWKHQRSGIRIPPEAAVALRIEWRKFLRRSVETGRVRARLPTFVEGAPSQILVSKRERNAKARELCLSTLGDRCKICGFSFGETYGPLGEGFAHVHHVDPLASGERHSRPTLDLIPVCANCHAMLHRRDPALSPAQLRRCLKRAGSRT